MWETSHLIHIRDFRVEIIKTFWEKTQNNPKSFIPFASSVGQDKMLARTRQYTWSQLIMNKNKQMILISSLLNPFTQFPFFIDWNTNNVNSDVFYNPFPLSVFPSYCVFFCCPWSSDFGKAVPTHPCWVLRDTKEHFAMRRWHHDVGA